MRLRILPTENFGDSENREDIVLVPEDLQKEFPPRFDPKYPGKPLWPDLLVSPSQIGTYTACARKWGWNKLEGIRGPETPAQAKGKEFHKALEDWLQLSKVPGEKFDRLLPALQHFPPLPVPEGRTVAVERYFAILVEDVVFHGYTDVDVRGVDHRGADLLEVYDLKTTKDFGWAKTTEALGGDPQNSIYALKQMVERYGTPAPTVTCYTRWVYMLTEGPRQALPVDKRWTFEEACQVVSGWLVFARAMRDAYRVKPPVKELSCNLNHCGAYRGCEYQSLCAISSKDRVKAMFMQDKLAANKKTERKEMMGLTIQQKIQQDLARKGQAVPPSGGVVPVQKMAGTPSEAPKATETTATVPSTAQVSKSPGKTSLADLAKSIKSGETPVQKTETAPKAETPKAVATGINPPDASPDPRLMKTQQEEAQVVNLPIQTSPEPAQAASEPVAEEAPKKTRKKAEAATTAGTAAPAANSILGFMLLVDALAEKGPAVRRVDELISPLRQELEQKTNTPNYALIDYRKGPAMLAAGLRESFQNNKPIGTFFVDSRMTDPEVMLVLTEFADGIVRGVR